MLFPFILQTKIIYGVHTFILLQLCSIPEISGRSISHSKIYYRLRDIIPKLTFIAEEWRSLSVRPILFTDIAIM